MPLAEVELVEDVPARRPAPRWVRPVVAAVVVLAVLVVLGTTRVAAARRAEALGALGFARSLTDPVQQRWSAQVGGGPLLQTGPVEDRVVVVPVPGGLTGLAVDTGEVRWFAEVAGDCRAVGGGALTDGWAVTGSPDAWVWCAADGAGRAPDQELPEEGARDTLVGADGTVRAVLVTAGTMLAATVVEDHLVRAWADASGRLLAAQWTAAGEPGWSWRSGEPVFAGGATVSLAGNRLRVEGRTAVLLDLATGTDLPPDTPAADTGSGPSLDLPDGARATQVSARGRPPEVVVTGPAGELYRVTGALAGPPLDDGSVPDLLLVLSSGILTALDVRTGERVWAHDVAVVPIALAGGVVVAQGSGRTVALDAADGTLLWQHRTAAVVGADAVASDAVRVVTLQDSTDGPEAVARDLRSGQVRWRVPLPGAQAVQVLADGSVVVLDPAGLSLWR